MDSRACRPVRWSVTVLTRDCDARLPAEPHLPAQGVGGGAAVDALVGVANRPQPQRRAPLPAQRPAAAAAAVAEAGDRLAAGALVGAAVPLPAEGGGGRPAARHAPQHHRVALGGVHRPARLDREVQQVWWGAKCGALHNPSGPTAGGTNHHQAGF